MSDINKDNVIMTPRWRQVIENIVWREDPRKGFDSLVHVPGDRGGWTRAGISTPEMIRFFKEPVKINNIGTEEFGRQLTKDQIISYYWSEHILRPHFNILPESIDELIVDFSVTSGSDDATKAVQNAINSFIENSKIGSIDNANFRLLKVDGVFGPQTRKELIDLINDIRMYNFIREFTRWRIKHYINICKQSSLQIKFLEGWFDRAYSFLPKD